MKPTLKRRLRRILLALAILGGAPFALYFLGSLLITEMMIKDRFTPGHGEYQGAKWCQPCHPDHYAQWEASMHSKATTLEFQPIMLARTPACYSCHGFKEQSEGVSCEICHGPGNTVKTDFGPVPLCLRCHSEETPLAGVKTMMIGDEWLSSRARAEGENCSSCHMPQMEASGKKMHFHGFRGHVGHPEIYNGQVRIAEMRKNGKSVVIAVENTVTGHYMPTGCPTKYIELTLEAEGGHAGMAFSRSYVFQRKMGPLMDKVIDDNRLHDGEKRYVTFPVPAGASKLSATLRLYPSKMAPGARGKVITLDRKELGLDRLAQEQPR